MGFNCIFHEFRTLEDNLGLFNLKIKGVNVWDLVRFQVFEKIIREKGVFESRPVKVVKHEHGKSPKEKIRPIEWLLKSPIFQGRKDFYFFSAASSFRRNGGDNKAWDIYFDHLIDSIGPESCLLIESLDTADSNPHTKNVMYTNLLDGVIRRFGCSLFRVKFSDFEVELLDGIDAEIQKMFCVRANFPSMVSSAISYHLTNLFFYKKLLLIKSPKAVFLISSYGREYLIDACRQLSIPVIEIQHGVISPFHLGYSYPEGGKKVLFPDYFLTMGKYWEKSIRFPIDDVNIITLGAPYISSEMHGVRKGKKNILFVSQWSVGTKLSLFAMELSLRLGKEYNLYYKLHPCEYDTWRDRYPYLEQANINVVQNDDVSLSELFSECAFQVGVYSTAVFQGIAMGCKTYLVNLPGVEHMNDLVKIGIVKLVDHPSQVDFDAEFNNGVGSDYFFAESWGLNMANFIRRLGLNN
ncbi:hypothetical protein [Mariprofundus erugo]|nr:hypothetical protein [Mariprofundus erugo]